MEKWINKIINMDCIEGMKQLPEDFVEISITSPPYNVGDSIEGPKYVGYDDDLKQGEYFSFIKEVMKQMLRVTKYYSFFNFQMLSDNRRVYLELMDHFKYNIKDIIIWHKKQAAPASQPTCLTSKFEFVLVLSRTKFAKKRTFDRAFFNNREKGRGSDNVIYGNSATSKEMGDTRRENHHAVFPLYFVRWFLERFTKSGDLVMDPFMGYGTTARACKQMGRRFIGFEINKDYIEGSMKRLEQNSLFDMMGDKNGERN